MDIQRKGGRPTQSPYDHQSQDTIGNEEPVQQIYVDVIDSGLPDRLHLSVWGDSSVEIDSRISMLVSNGLQGLAVLFAGPSGTGKTMAAGIIANELKLDIYRIDLAGVVSKYIGETEKNLSRIFTEAEASNAILFFDEADALFGKRTEVKDSHDRYANIEVGYLLQRIEEYEGMVVLATNLRQNMDDAFVRRMQFIVEFPYPEEEHRYRIWKGIFPAQAPLDKGVDFEFLARQFKVAGGNIKNIALGAAFLAAADGEVITMKHLARAARREFNKMGKLCVETDFGPYYALAAEE